MLFIVAPPLTLLLLFWAEESERFNSAHVASLSLSDSGVSRDTAGEKQEKKNDFSKTQEPQLGKFSHEKLIVC